MSLEELNYQYEVEVHRTGKMELCIGHPVFAKVTIYMYVCVIDLKIILNEKGN